MSLQIRPATTADHSAIWAILHPVFRAGDTYAIDPDISEQDAISYWCGSERHVYVAEENGEILGTYYITRNQKGGGSHVCNCGYVTAEAARGKGVARAMLTHSLNTAPQLGFRAMQYNFVISTNERAIKTWKHAGFEIIGRLPGAFQHPEQGYVDALIMYKTLSPAP
jgi:L-amino acid N-acyltransferase YncA